MAISSIGNRGTGVSGASGTTVALTPNGTAAVDRILVVAFASTSGPDHTAVSDSSGNIYTRIGLTTGNSQTVSIWVTKVAVQLTTGSTIWGQLGSAVVDKCLGAWEFSVGSGNTLRAVAGNQTATASASNGFGSTAHSGLSSAERCYFMAGCKGANTTTALTASTNFTSTAWTIRSRNNASARILRAEFRINTSTGETSNPTLAVSGNYATLHVALEETTEPAANRALLIDGEQDVLQLSTRSNINAVTMLGWAKLVSDTNDFGGIFTMEEGPGHSDGFNELIVDSNGTTLAVYDHNGGGTNRGTAGTMVVGTWHKVAIVFTSSTVFKTYFGTMGTPGTTEQTFTRLAIASNDYQGVGSSQFASTETFEGALQGVRVWNAALSKSEIEAEFTSATPVRTADLLKDGLRPDVTVATVLTNGDGADFVDGNGGGTPDYSLVEGPTLDPGTGYTLAADSGAVAITGTSAALKRGLKVVAASGSISISGTAASLKLGAKIAAAPGAIALTGTAATLLKASKIVAAFGAVDISGTAAALKRAVILSCAPGAIAITGTDAALRRGVTFNAGSVAIPISGSPAVLQPPASSTAVPITGTAAALTQARRLVAAFGTVPFNGTAASLSKGLLMSAASGAVSVTGTAATLNRGLKISASSGTTSFTGTSAQLRVAHRLASESGSIPLTGSSCGLFFGRKLSAAFGAVAFSGTAATLSRTRHLVATPGSVSITGTAADLSYNSIADPVLVADEGAIDFTGSTASLRFARRLVASSGALSVAGTAANIGPLEPRYALPGEESKFTAPRSALATAVLGTEADALFVEGDERMSTWKIKKGDYHRRLTLDLTTITTVGASGVTFRIRKIGAAALTVDAAGVIDSPTRVSYQFVSPQLETVGRYRAEVRLQYLDGPESVPTEGWLNMEILPNV